MSKRGCVVLFSGGMDSMLLMKMASREFDRVVPLFVNYGQTHLRPELRAATEYAGDELRLIEAALPVVMSDASPIVPGRNAVLLSLAVAKASASGCCEVWIGCCAADAAVFHDCRPAFIHAFATASSLATPGIHVRAPLLDWSKRDIREALGEDLGDSWSCYFPNNDKPCGECGACKARVQ